MDTDLWRSAETSSRRSRPSGMAASSARLYAGHIEGYAQAIPRIAEAGGLAREVAQAVEKALTAKRPRARYVVGPGRADAGAPRRA